MTDYLGMVSEEPLCLKASVVFPREVMHCALQVKGIPSTYHDFNNVFVSHGYMADKFHCLQSQPL